MSIPLTPETFRIYEAEAEFDALGGAVAEVIVKTGFTWEQIAEAIGGMPESGRNYYVSLARIRRGIKP
jgi:hypothetical protein